MPLLTFKSEDELVSFARTHKLPEWQAKLFKKFAEAIQVHSQGQLFYKVDRLFPNEHPDSKAHRILSFESITEASFARAANNINRIFKNSSYTVEASEKTIQITSGHTFEGQNFYNWFLDEWVSSALKEDPNSRIAFYPPEYVSEGHPPVVFVSSERVVFFDEDQVIFVSETESDVTYTLEELRPVREQFYDQSIEGPNFRQSYENTFTPKITAKINRYVYHAFFKGVGFYRIEQLKDDLKKWEVTFYPIKQDFLPVTDAGGEKERHGVNKSFLHPFVQFGNLALLQHSQHVAVNFTFSFPRMSEVETPCEYPGCLNGFVECDISESFPEGKKPCRSCGGTGWKAPQSPYKVYKKRFDPLAPEGENKHLSVPDVQYYTPDTAILNYSKGEWKDYLEMAEMAVYIQQRIQTGNIPSAKSKEIDREDLYAFLARVGQVFFSKIRFALQAFENYYVSSPTRVSVNIPYSFAILSEGEAFAALKDILSSAVPVMIKANQVESFINKFVSQSSPIIKFLQVLKQVDTLLYYSFNEIMSFRSSNVITADKMATHVYSYPVLQQLYTQDKTLFLQEVQVIVDKLTEALKPFMPPLAQTLQQKVQDLIIPNE